MVRPLQDRTPGRRRAREPLHGRPGGPLAAAISRGARSCSGLGSPRFLLWRLPKWELTGGHHCRHATGVVRDGRFSGGRVPRRKSCWNRWSRKRNEEALAITSTPVSKLYRTTYLYVRIACRGTQRKATGSPCLVCALSLFYKQIGLPVSLICPAGNDA